MEQVQDMITLSRLLEAEWRGAEINRMEAHRLADKLLPHFPEISVTLTSVKKRMAQTHNMTRQ